MSYPRHFLFLVWSFFFAHPVQAKPTWTFTVVVAVETQTANYFQNAYGKPIDQLVRQQLATVNANFNSSGNFNGIYNFRVDSIYVFDGPAQTEVTRPHPNFQYRIVIDGKFTQPAMAGGWYGAYQTVYHSWNWDFFDGPFASAATDGLTHEFGHARGGIDIYALRVEGGNNPVDGQPFEPVNSIMNYPYGNITWDEYTTNLLNSTADGPIVGDHWITSPFPNTLGIRALSSQGSTLSSVSLTIYPVEWYSNTVSWFPIGGGSTNADGVYAFSSNPFQPATNGYPWTMRYCNFLIKAVYNSVTVYAWLPLYDVQNAYFRNGTNSTYNVEIVFPANTPIIQLSSVYPTSVCPNNTIDVTFTPTGSFGSDNQFHLFVVDNNNNSYGIAYLNGATGATLSGIVPDLSPGEYKVRVGSTKPNTQSNYLSFTIKPVPSPPTVQSLLICLNDPAPILQANGQNLLWYMSLSGKSGISVPPTPDTRQAGQINYYVSQTIDGCESRLATLPVTIDPIHTIKSGLWTDPSVWSCNRVPIQTDEPILSAGHSLSVTGITASIKRIIYQIGSKLILSSGGRLSLGNMD